ncbi:MAG: hypothetical protein O8C66_03735 [Candidatus Methanoperedens sp.]|nr:hypothetical protein [Candidatus Methanoperedens sp.]MCZ7369598.1 hypothetical protein [Candidatus Methanoperedens sp.]
MEFKEINIPGGIIQQIDREGLFAGIAVDAGNGPVPEFMNFFPKVVLVHDRSSWKMVGEIDMERARYLLSTDEMLEEMLGKTQG